MIIPLEDDELSQFDSPPCFVILAGSAQIYGLHEDSRSGKTNIWSLLSKNALIVRDHDVC